MYVGRLCSGVMRGTLFRSDTDGPHPTHRSASTPVSIGLAALPVVVVVAASYPAPFVVALGLLVAARYGPPALERVSRALGLDSSGDRVCVPGTDVCVRV